MDYDWVEACKSIINCVEYIIIYSAESQTANARVGAWV